MAAGDLGAFTYAARLAEVYRSARARSSRAGWPRSEATFQFGAAAGVRLADRRLTVGPEVFGSTVTDMSAFAKRNTPVEVLLEAATTSSA